LRKFKRFINIFQFGYRSLFFRHQISLANWRYWKAPTIRYDLTENRAKVQNHAHPTELRIGLRLPAADADAVDVERPLHTRPGHRGAGPSGHQPVDPDAGLPRRLRQLVQPDRGADRANPSVCQRDPMDFSAWFEAYLGGEWYTFDARNNIPRIGRVLIARGRDAADVAISTTFGANTLHNFTVLTEEVAAVE
jgi:hypothetical protein